MVLEFQTLGYGEIQPETEEIPDPTLALVEGDEQYGSFVVEPLEQGFALTLGNPMRRALYGSLVGTAVTWVKIEGILHEYATIPHVHEEVAEFLLNVKGIRLRSEVDRPGRLRLEVSGAGEVSAGDIMASSDFEVVNPELHLATLDSNEAKLSVELNVERGVGYREASEADGLPIGVLPVDAVFSPIRKVNYRVEPTRVGQRTDFETLGVEVWTDGTITPMEAMREAANNLIKHLFLFTSVKTGEGGEEISPIALKISPEQYNLPVEQLDLSSRTLNCLKRAGIDKVGQVLELKKSELLEIRNFGEKSMTELYERLAENDLLPEDSSEDGESSDQDENEQTVED